MEAKEHIIALSCKVTLTPEEASEMTKELDDILQRFQKGGHNGRTRKNPIMAKALNKVYSAITGEEHPCVVANLESIREEYYKNADPNYHTLLSQYHEIEEKNITSMVMRINIGNRSEKILLNKLEAEYLLNELNSLRAFYKPHTYEIYDKTITNKAAIASIEKMHKAIIDGELVLIPSSGTYDDEEEKILSEDLRACEVSLTSEEAQELSCSIKKILDSLFDDQNPLPPVTTAPINDLYHALSGQNHDYVESGKLRNLEEAFYAGSTPWSKVWTRQVKQRKNVITMLMQININGNRTTLFLNYDDEIYVKMLIEGFKNDYYMDATTNGVKQIAQAVYDEMSLPADVLCYNSEQGLVFVKK